jgi:Peptidase family S41/N-terminal domain of Peptidase_S41 in eukaryotic IRBP
MEADVDQAEVEQIQRVINHEMRERFALGSAQRAVLLQHGDDPAIEPGQLMVRVFLPPPGEGEDYEQALTAWQDAHQAGMDTLRRELSLRLPAARLLEFTFDDADPATPRILMPDDGSLAAEQMSGREIVTTALALLRANYVFPELADRAATAVEARLAAGEYDGLDEITLTDLVTRHLQEVCEDKHLALRLGSGPGPGGGGPGGPGPGGPGGPGGSGGPGGPGPGGPGPDGPGPGGPDGRGRRPGPDLDRPKGHEARRLAMRQMGRLDNFGIHRVERLDGNVGYLDVRRVPVPANAGPAISAAMELVAGTYALIIDLRRNGGGAPEGVVYWCSHLVDEQPPTHLNDIFRADTGETHQFWALPYVPGPRYLDRPVYVLTSSRTFSGGEDFAYTLQALGRAQVIGETTGGGAHPTRPFGISAAVLIAIPFARSINPVTGTNWQGTGVIPDIAVPEAEAYDTAYAKALEHVLAMDVFPPVADEAREALAERPEPPAAVPG